MYEYETSKTKLRLTQFLKKIGSNNNQFVVKMGYASNFLNSKSGISEDRLTEIAIAYPNLNMNWLLTGDGEMLKNISENSENNLKQTISEERNTESTNENQDVPMSEILEFMKLVSSNMDSQLKSFHLQMSEQRVEMREQRIAMMAELKEQRLAMVEQFTKLYTLMDKQFTEVAKRNEAESKILQAMVNKIAQVDEKTGRIIQLQKVSGD